MKRISNVNKGITLISLVITIIVLLILAGVSITMLTGENGILNQANDAKKLNKIAEEKEEIALAYTQAISNDEDMYLEAKDLNAQFLKDGTKAIARDDNGNIKIFFEETKNIYIIDEAGNANEVVNEDVEIVEEVALELKETDEGYAYWTTNGTGTITGYTGTLSKVIVPCKIGEEEITTIGSNVFLGKNEIKEIVISKGITTLGYQSLCSNTESIYLPSTIVTLGQYAFMNCKKLQSLEIPESVTTIESSCFSGCTGISEIYIPSGVSKVGMTVFGSWTATQTINIGITLPEGSTKPSGWDNNWDYGCKATINFGSSKD